ncbi:MAG: hypothetical protein AAFY71_22565 [Bacteroidota bacterium]
MNLIKVSHALFEDVSLYLTALTHNEYCQGLEVLSGSSLGQHTRHVIEFYQCLVDQCKEGKVNYDCRKRNLMIEQNPDFALQVIEDILQKLPLFRQDKAVKLICDYDNGVDENSFTWSSYGRELAYNIEHTIHHLAMIKIGLRQMRPDIALPQGFGVAPSTIRHQNKEKKVSASGS